MPAASPNILIVMADQLTPGALPAYGHRLVRTPHIDRLAEQGVVFESAYCNSPLCAPSRYSLLTGKLPSRIGAFDNAAELPAEALTFAHHLRHAGYRTALAGKMHFAGPDQLHGFEERLTTDIYPADFGWTPDWNAPHERPEWYHNMRSVLEAGPCVRTNQLDYDEEVVFAARRQLFDLARSGDGRPFCLVVSLTHPHDPYVISRPYWDLYRDEDIDLPRVNLPLAAWDPHSLRLREVCDIGRKPPGEARVRAARRAYYGAISFVDEQVGILLQALRDAGQADDTVVVFAGDHGDMLGERGLWYKMNFFEGAARVPLIVHAPRRFTPRRIAASISLADLLPTLVDIAHDGRAPAAPEPVDGRSLWPHLTGDEGHDEAIGEYLGEGALAPIVMIRRGPWKYVHSRPDPDQLYDLSRDPDELVNRAGDPAAAAVLEAFRTETARRWNLDDLHRTVLASQRRRHFHFAAESRGARRSWDFQPFTDASRQYVRSHLDLDTTEARARFPRV